MANQRDATEDEQARLDALVELFRAAEKRQLLKRGILLWTRAEKEQRIAQRDPDLSSEKMN
jgi:hypothetical protein